MECKSCFYCLYYKWRDVKGESWCVSGFLRVSKLITTWRIAVVCDLCEVLSEATKNPKKRGVR